MAGSEVEVSPVPTVPAKPTAPGSGLLLHVCGKHKGLGEGGEEEGSQSKQLRPRTGTSDAL